MAGLVTTYYSVGTYVSTATNRCMAASSISMWLVTIPHACMICTSLSVVFVLPYNGWYTFADTNAFSFWRLSPSFLAESIDCHFNNLFHCYLSMLATTQRTSKSAIHKKLLRYIFPDHQVLHIDKELAHILTEIMASKTSWQKLICSL